MPVISAKALVRVFDSYSWMLENFGHGVDLHAGEGLRRIDEPLHLRHLLVLAQRGGLELVVDPLLRGIDLLRMGWRAMDEDARRSQRLRHAPLMTSRLFILFPFPSYPAP